MGLRRCGDRTLCCRPVRAIDQCGLRNLACFHPLKALRLCPPAAEIIMFDDVIVVYRFIGDLMFFVTGSQDENEVILYAVLQCFYDAITLLLR